MDSGGLEPGDIVFYKTARDGAPNAAFDNLEPDDFEDHFKVIAAYGQGYPYFASGAGYRPWFHVAVYVGGEADEAVVGFNSAVYQAGQGVVFTPMARGDLGAPTQDVLMQVLRPPSVEAAEIIANTAIAQVQVGTPYSIRGLVAFALGIIYRMLPAGTLRDQMKDEARGAAAFAREDAPTEESCVTGVINAVHAAGIGLTFNDPSPPPNLPSEQDHHVARMIDACLETLKRGQLFDETLNFDRIRAVERSLWDLAPLGDLPLPLQPIARLDFPREIPLDAIPADIQLQDLEGLGPDVRFGGPPSLGGASDYIVILEQSSNTLSEDEDRDSQKLADKGVEVRDKPFTDPAVNLIVTPAMLWDALRAVDPPFTEVTIATPTTS